MSINVGATFTDAIETAMKERGHLNVLIAGRSGVGKSTLINSVFQDNLAETGQGRPVTQNTREITKEGVPLTIFDTRGIEMAGFSDSMGEIKKLLVDRCGDRDSNRHIHVAWICIQEDGRRVEDAEIALHKLLAEHVPVLAVVTKARSDNGFRQVVQGLLPEARNTMRVRAVSEVLDEGIELGPLGLEALIEATSELLPEGKRRALAASQKASTKYKTNQSYKIVAAAATAAAGAGASPIPFSDTILLVPIQVGMIAGITSVFGLELSKGTLSALTGSALGVTGTSLAGRAVVTNLLKCFPGAGTVAGGAISAATASTLTVALGKAYISALDAAFEQSAGEVPDIGTITELLKAKMAAGSQDESATPASAAAPAIAEA